MKLSKYNRFIETGEYVLGFNGGTCGFAEFEPAVYAALQAFEKGQLTPEQDATLAELLPALRQGRFMVEDGENEVDTLRVMHNIGKFDSTALTLTIAPTMNCNFRCIYCYEGELSPEVMSAEVQQAIVDFVTKSIRQTRSLNVCWYGGEPLLGLDVIANLSEQFIKLCSDHECEYSASIVTNGWLLKREIAEQLVKYKINMVQVTLDGTPEVHNARRPLKSGGATFERILENVLNVYDLFARLAIRINVDNTNIERILEVYELLHAQKLLGKVYPYLGKVTADTQACADFEACCLDSASFAKLEVEVYKALKARGLPAEYPYPRFISSYCGVNRLGSYVIDPVGNLYKCWNVTGNREESVGNLCAAEASNFRFSKWLAIEPFDIPECRQCDILPLCAGGCPHYYYRGDYEKSQQPNCLSWRFALDEMLLLWYHDWKEAKKAQDPA